VQSESQKVVYKDNHFMLSPYPTEGEQISTIKVRSASIFHHGLCTHVHARFGQRTTIQPWRRSFGSVQPTPAA
jgi:hypothetical protein